MQSLSRGTFSAMNQQHASSSLIINKCSLILIAIHYHPPLIHCIHIQLKIHILIHTTSNVSCNSKCLRVYLCLHFVETVDHWWCKRYAFTGRGRYNAVNFLQKFHKEHPIARLLGGGGVSYVYLSPDWYVASTTSCYIPYRLILGRVLTAPDYIMKIKLLCLDIY